LWKRIQISFSNSVPGGRTDAWLNTASLNATRRNRPLLASCNPRRRYPLHRKRRMAADLLQPGDFSGLV